MKMGIHLCISGFTQDESTEHGVYLLSEELRTWNSQTNRVWLRTWNSNWSDIAQNLFLLNRRYEVRINVYGYSWGGGWGAVQLAKELEKRGMKIETMVLSDPVHRHPVFLLRWRSLFKRNSWLAPTITIPDNVENLYSFFQTEDRHIQGHKLKSGPHTNERKPIKIDREHMYMDDSKLWRRTCIRASQKLNQFLKEEE